MASSTLRSSTRAQKGVASDHPFPSHQRMNAITGSVATQRNSSVS